LPANIDLFVSGMFAAYVFRLLATRHEKATEGTVGMDPARRRRRHRLRRDLRPHLRDGDHGEELAVSVFPVAFPLLDLSFVALTLGSLSSEPTPGGGAGQSPLVFLAYISYNLLSLAPDDRL